EKYVRIVRDMAAVMAKARALIVPGAGHTVHLERPESFRALVLEFLRCHRGSAAVAPARRCSCDRGPMIRPVSRRHATRPTSGPAPRNEPAGRAVGPRGPLLNFATRLDAYMKGGENDAGSVEKSRRLQGHRSEEHTSEL